MTRVQRSNSTPVVLQAAQALAAWLERRPQFGWDSFVRGRPEIFGVSLEATPVLDAVEFLWASLALFDDGTADPDTVGVYRSVRADLHTVAEARTGSCSFWRKCRTARRGSAAAGAAGQVRGQSAAGAALALGLGQHLQRQPGTGQARGGGAGAGRTFTAIQVEGFIGAHPPSEDLRAGLLGVPMN